MLQGSQWFDGEIDTRASLLAVGLQGEALTRIAAWARNRSVRLLCRETLEDPAALELRPELLVVGCLSQLESTRIDALREQSEHLQVLAVVDEPGETLVRELAAAWAAGADDVLRPSSGPELEFRLDRCLSRATADTGRTLRVGPLSIDAGGGVVSVGDRRLSLRPAEFAILAYLCEHRHEPVSCARLTREALRTVANEHTVRNHVYEIRRKLDQARPRLGRLIQTVRGDGYRISTGATLMDPESRPAPEP